MSENAKIPAAQKTIQDPPEYNAGNVKKPGEDYGQTKGGVATQTGTQAKGDGYTKHRFNETPSEAEKTLQEKPSSDISGPTGSGKIEGDYQSASHSTGYTDQLGSSDWLGGPQNGNETPGNGGNVQGVDTLDDPLVGRRYGSGNAGNGGNGGNGGNSSDVQVTGFGSSEVNVSLEDPVEIPSSNSEASKQAPDRSGSQAYTDKLGGSSDN